VDSTTAKDVTKYSVKRAGIAAVPLTVATATSTLSTDGTTVVITLVTSLTNAGNVFTAALSNGDQFQVLTTGVKNVGFSSTVADTTTNVIYSDSVAPTLVSATATAKTSTNTITVAFSESIDVSAATVTINGTGAIVAAGSNSNEVTITSTNLLTAGTAYTLSLLNFKDWAGNYTATNPLSTSVTVTTDATAPMISGIAVPRNSSFEVSFSKDMDATTITAGSLRLLDANLVATPAVTTVLPKVISGVTSKTIFVITVTGLPYNVSNVFNGIVAYASTIKDLSGNAIAAGTVSVTATKDVVAPAFASASYQKVSTYNTIVTPNGAIVVKYSKLVQAGAALIGDYTIIDDLGSTVANTVSTISINPNDKSELVLVLAVPIVSTAKTYSIVLPGTAVKDLSIEMNTAAAANTTVDVSTGTPVAGDTSKPTVAFSAVAAATLVGGVYTPITFALAIADVGTSGLDMATVTNTANYILDGASLPGGSYVTYLAGVATTIHIPTGTVASDKTYSLNVNNIKDKAGNIANPFVDTTSIVLKSDIKPVFTTAVINSNGSISLGFSKGVSAQVALTSADFQITANRVLIPVAKTVFTNGTGSDDGKYVVTLAAMVDAGADNLPDTTADNRVFIDANGNGTYDAGVDILVTTGTTTAIGATTADANLLSTLTVKANTAVTVTDTKTLLNPMKTGTVITVK